MSKEAARYEIYSGTNKTHRSNEPSGESESLRGRDLSDMGSRAQRATVPDEIKKIQQTFNESKAIKKSQSVNITSKKKIISGNQNLNILTAEIASDKIYRPKTNETRQYYNQIIHLLKPHLYDVPQNILDDTLTEIISILKFGELTAAQKKEELNAIIRVEEGLFSKVLTLSENLKDFDIDFGQEEEQQSYSKQQADVIVNIGIDELEGGAEDYGIGFGQEQDDENTDRENMMVVDEKNPQVEDQEADEKDEEGEDFDTTQDQTTASRSKLQDDLDDDVQFSELGEVQEATNHQEPQNSGSKIDGDWLWKKLGELEQDPVKAKQIGDKLIGVLNLPNSIQISSKLMEILGMQNYKLIAEIFENRKKVYYLTILGNAESEEERLSILSQLRDDKEASELLREIESEAVYDPSQQGSTNDSYLTTNYLKEVKSLKIYAEEAQKEREKFANINNLDNQDFANLSKSVLNLDSLKFTSGGHQMSNSKCLLPPGSSKTKNKGYEEVFIPPAERTDKQKIKLIPVEDLPAWTHAAFDENTKKLNPIQSRVYETAFKSSINTLICAPTGAGKTNIALLTILREIGICRSPDGDIDLTKFKIVYVAPMKALVSEIVGSFQKRLEPYGVQVREMTGDMQLSRKEIEQTQIIVATPEKWDIVTRKNGDKVLLDSIRLLIIDEIHLLHDSRGPVLESIVARTIRHSERTKKHIRIVALSATLPNYIDVATFLRIDAKSGGLFYFDSSYRPIPLEQRYIGITDTKGMRSMMLMKEILYERVIERVTKQQILIFCHSRGDTARTGRDLKDTAYANDQLEQFFQADARSKKVLEAEVERVIDPALKELLPFGIGIHHAGLCRDDRKLVEDLFSDRILRVLISTATLAWGVNLPARTVIIKGTQIYSPEKGDWIELSPQDMLQMLGRAGRPGLDDRGEGIIITGHKELKYYLSLINNQLPIESQFVDQLADQLNAEIVMGTVTNLIEAVDWLGYSYLYTRMMKEPQIYQIPVEDLEEDKMLIKRRSNLIHSAALILNKNNLIRYDRRAGTFTPTTLGRIASHYYIKHPSIAVYSEHIRQDMDMIDLFRVFSLSAEFKYVPVRDSEKIELENLLSLVPIPIRGTSDDPRTKINVLLQAHISKMSLDGYVLKSDMVYVTQSAARIMRGLFEVFIKRGWANVANNCLQICKMIDKRQWSCMTPLRQYCSLPENIFRRIENQEHLTWEHFYNMTSEQIGNVIKYPNQGENLHKLIHRFPRLKLNAYVQPLTRSRIKIELTISTDFEWVNKIHGNMEPFWIMVTDVDDEVLLHYEFFVLHKKNHGKELSFEFTVALLEPLHPQYFIKVVSDRWLNCESAIPISFKNLLLPSKFPPCTELVEIQNIETQQIESQQLQRFLKTQRINKLNQIQTQVFHVMYNQFKHVMLCAPGNSGKTTVALFGLARLFEEDIHKKNKSLFLVPKQELVTKNLSMLSDICKVYSRKICILTGNIKTDLELMQEADLIISTAEHYDNVSRRWRVREVTQRIRLVIFEHIHMLNEKSCAYEVVCSRLRYMFAELEIKVRFIALGMSISNSRDVSDWLGVSAEHVFNFHPKNRPIPLGIYIQSFDQHEVESRFFTMTRSLYQTLDSKCGTEPVIIFASDKKAVRLAAVHLSSYTSESRNDNRFLHVLDEEQRSALRDSISMIKDTYLKFCLTHGIGFIVTGMPELYKKLQKQLFVMGIIQVLILTNELCWEIDIRAKTVVMLDMNYYDGQQDRFISYPINQVLEMMGRAGRGKIDKQSQVLLLCHSALKNHLKKFLFDPVPVESHLHHFLAEHINSEIASGSIDNKQECMDWIAWTFFYRRLQHNPNYYNLLGTTDTHKNEHLSDLIEQAVEDLSKAECIVIENEFELSTINGGMISSYYYIDIGTVNLYLQSIEKDCKWKNLLEILSASREFDSLPIGRNEDNLLRQLTAEAIHAPKKPNFCDPSVKANLLIQAHLRRAKLTPEFHVEKTQIIPTALQLLKAMTDCISYKGFLKPTIMVMKLSQMIVQGMWLDDCQLKQLPYVDSELIERAKEMKIETIDEVMDMEDEDRNNLLRLTEEKLMQFATACNRYPDVDIEIEDPEFEELEEGEEAEITVNLTREGLEEGEKLGPVISLAYPDKNEECWWIVAGDSVKNKVLGIKRVTFDSILSTKLKITAPEPGDYNVKIYLICDSYIGCDQESDRTYHFTVTPESQE